MDSRRVNWLRRNVKWTTWTYHHKTHLLYVATTDYGRVYTYHGQDYLVNSEGEVGKIPYYVSVEVRGVHRNTATWGPYRFFNGFETTAEAEYIKKMFQYPKLTERAQQKVTDIFTEYSPWISTDTEFTDALMERERRLRDEQSGISQ